MKKLKDARKQADLSQEQLAQQLSLSRSTVAKWESGLGVPNISKPIWDIGFMGSPSLCCPCAALAAELFRLHLLYRTAKCF